MTLRLVDIVRLVLGVCALTVGGLTDCSRLLATGAHWFSYPNINPVAFHVGPLSIRWYGLSYLFGAIFVYLQLQSRRSRERTGLTIDQAQELVVYAMIGVIVGGRLFFLIADMLTPASAGGHSASYYAQNPLEIIAIWHGGMAFHGGFIGALIGIWLFIRRRNSSFFRVTDEIALWIPRRHRHYPRRQLHQ